MGDDPTTSWMATRGSTVELQPQNGASGRDRTDVNYSPPAWKAGALPLSYERIGDRGWTLTTDLRHS